MEPEKIDRIGILAEKLRELASQDSEFKVFGASTFGTGHHYRLNPPIDLRDLAAFEAEFTVELPADYRDFLLRVGNGGAGPNYGLYSLDGAVTDAPGHKSRDFLAAPFRLTTAFNPYSEDASHEDLFGDQWICGSVILSHQGCGYFDRLVITGPQRGQVWTDGRVGDQGIFPLQCDFYEWYDHWLADSLDSLQR